MKLTTHLLLLLSFITLTFVAHAEGGCPAGMIPYSGTNTSSCGPVPPGYYESNQHLSQATPVWAERWGAIVYDNGSTNVGLGVATNMESKELAEQMAMKECREKGGSECRVDLTYYNQCAVVTAGIHYVQSRSEATIQEASADGLKDCNQAGVSGCAIYYSACSLPERIQ